MKKVVLLLAGCILLLAGLYLDAFWYCAPDGNRSPYLPGGNLLPGLLTIILALRSADPMGGYIKVICVSLLAVAIPFAGLANVGAKIERDNLFHDVRRYDEFRERIVRRWRASIFPVRIPADARDVRLSATTLLDPTAILDFHAPPAYLRSVTRTYLPQAKHVQRGSDGLPFSLRTQPGDPNVRLPEDFRVIVLKTANVGYDWPAQGIAVSEERGEIIYFFVDS